jgi:hypothetical protein
MQRTEVDLYLEKRLSVWASWCLREKGWPPETLLAIMLEVGNLSRSCCGSSVPVGLINEWAEEINTWINRMREQRPEYADAIRAYYLEQTNEKRVRHLAKERRIPVSTFFGRVKGAKDWLSGRLDAEASVPNINHKMRA